MTIRAWLVACLLLAAASGAHAQAAADGARAELAPLSAQGKALLAAIPDEGTPPPQQHYFRSNEWFHALLTPSLSGRGGAYVGVGSDQNYTMAALARSELLLLIDYDPKIPWVHRIYDVFVRSAATADDLVASFAPERLEQSSAQLRGALKSDPAADAIVKHFQKRNREWHPYLARVRRTPSSWLADPGHYAHVRSLFQQGRVISRNGDLTATSTLRAMAEAARTLRTPVRVIYFSNAEQFFKYTEQFRASMAQLPTDERSVVVRTVHHGKLRNAAPDDPTEWHYMVQEFPDFTARMNAGYRTSFRFVRDVVAHREQTASGDALSLLTSKVPIEGLR